MYRKVGKINLFGLSDIKMKDKNSLFNAAYRNIDAADALIASDKTPFAAVYKQYKSLQSLWFRVIEESVDSNSSRMEDLSIDLEEAIQRVQTWINENSPTKNKESEEDKTGE